MRPYILFGVGDHLFFTRNVVTVSLFATITLALIVISFRARVLVSAHAIAALAMSCLLFLMFVALAFSVGSTTYQTWKFLASMQCLIIVFAMVSVYSTLIHKGLVLKTKRNFLLGLLLSVIAYSAVVTGQDTFRYMTVVPTKDLIIASKSPKIHSITNLTIAMRPYLETMIVPVILDIYGARFGSDTYLGSPGPPSGCLLRYRPEMPDGSGFSPLIASAEGHKLPFPDKSFDVVMIDEVIEQLVDTDSIMEEIHRVLTDQGQLLISTPNLASWFNPIALLFDIQPAFSEVSFKKVYGRPGIGIVGHLRLFTKRALTAFVEDNGFHNTKTVGVPFPELPKFVRPLDTFLSQFPSIAGGLVMRADKEPR